MAFSDIVKKPNCNSVSMLKFRKGEQSLHDAWTMLLTSANNVELEAFNNTPLIQ